MDEKITSLKQLKELSKEGWLECAIILKYGLRSVKEIRWNSKKKRFSIVNYIDGHEQSLTPEEINCKTKSNIGEAIKKGAFIICSINR